MGLVAQTAKTALDELHERFGMSAAAEKDARVLPPAGPGDDDDDDEVPIGDPPDDDEGDDWDDEDEDEDDDEDPLHA